jgi:hypothetical protein
MRKEVGSSTPLRTTVSYCAKPCAVLVVIVAVKSVIDLEVTVLVRFLTDDVKAERIVNVVSLGTDATSHRPLRSSDTL